MKTHAPRFRPRFEALEDRRCPAVSVSVVDGHILKVDGDRGNNAVIIAQDGDQVTVTGDGSSPVTYTGIDTARVNTWAGDDIITIHCTDKNKRIAEFHFDMDLGAGDDMVTLLVPPEAP